MFILYLGGLSKKVLDVPRGWKTNETPLEALLKNYTQFGCD
jgi:hypothetical protein